MMILFQNGQMDAKKVKVVFIFHLAGTKAFEVGWVRPDVKPASVTKLANQPCCPAAPPGGLSEWLWRKTETGAG